MMIENYFIIIEIIVLGRGDDGLYPTDA